MFDGLVVVDKPAGFTSHDVVAKLRKAFGQRKVGHAGTLDPMATGLLVIGVGRATRLLRFLGETEKTYEGTLRLGTETTTLDADGEMTRRAPVDVDDGDIRAAMAAKIGTSMQSPPAFSAVQVGGRRLYDAARKGETLEAPPRPVSVARFDLVVRRGDEVDFLAVVGGGTYVRVLAADVGATLGCGAHLLRLRRTAIGPFDVADASPPEAVGRPEPVERAVAHLPKIAVDAEEARAATNGRVLAPAGIDGPYGVYGPDGRLIGVWQDRGASARPEMVLARGE